MKKERNIQEKFNHEYDFFYYLNSNSKKIDTLKKKLKKRSTKDVNYYIEYIQRIISKYLEEMIELLIKINYQSRFIELNEFVQNSFTRSFGGNYIFFKKFSISPYKIPTVFFLLGGISSNFEYIYCQLCRLIRKDSELVIPISLPYYNKKLKIIDVLETFVYQMFETILDIIVKRVKKQNPKKKYNEDEIKKIKIKASRILKIPNKKNKNPMKRLKNWFKKINNTNLFTGSNLIFIITDLNQWKKDIVENIFEYFQYLISQGLPIVVLCGIISLRVIYDKFSFGIKQIIYARNFRLIQADKVLLEIVNTLVCSEWWPLQFSLKISKTLIQNFLSSSFVIKKLTEWLKLFVNHHFRNNKFPKIFFLLNFLHKENWKRSKKTIESFSLVHFIQIKNLPSIFYLNSGENKNENKTKIANWCKNWIFRHRLFCQSFRYFKVFFEQFFSVNEIEFYFDFLENNLQKSKFYGKFETIIQDVQNSNDIIKIIKILQIWLTNLPNEIYNLIKLESKIVIKKLINVKRKINSKKVLSSENLETKKVIVNFFRISSKRKINKKFMKEGIKNKKEGRSRRNIKKHVLIVDQCKDCVKNLIFHFAIRFLSPINSVPLNEVTFCETTNSLIKVLIV